MACRDRQRGEEAMAKIRAASQREKTGELVFLQLDLADLAGVDAAVREFIESDPLS